MTAINAKFQWKCEPQAEKWILQCLDEAKRNNHFLEGLEEELRLGTSTTLLDWLDHITVEETEERVKELEKAGFTVLHTRENYRIWRQPAAKLPDVVLQAQNAAMGISICVESIAHFLMVRGLTGKIEGTPFSGYRRCLVSHENGIDIWVVERRGVETMEPTWQEPGDLALYFEAKEKWLTRPRSLVEEEEGFEYALRTASEIVDAIGEAPAACLILECEREYWQARNTAGQLQKNRQDRHGMGWANHDHHTFRSSRRHFVKLVKLFEILGFHCRERYYAGEEAGWGAQVMENPRAKLVLFLDVDLGSDEIIVDFAHEALPERNELGTIGLWCELHGDSILKAGMHHLEAQFMFEHLTDDLKRVGIGMMDPFSNFPYLKQAFTQGEIWHVNPERIQRLRQLNLITSEQAEKFIQYGAVGSHLENLQRKEGYKGFNQKNVSIIIKKTDPRTL